MGRKRVTWRLIKRNLRKRMGEKGGTIREGNRGYIRSKHVKCEYENVTIKPKLHFLESHYVVHTGLELTKLLPQPPQCWNYRYAPPCLETMKYTILYN
jgi:hypothetical protein